MSIDGIYRACGGRYILRRERRLVATGSPGNIPVARSRAERQDVLDELPGIGKKRRVVGINRDYPLARIGSEPPLLSRRRHRPGPEDIYVEFRNTPQPVMRHVNGFANGANWCEASAPRLHTFGDTRSNVVTNQNDRLDFKAGGVVHPPPL